MEVKGTTHLKNALNFIYNYHDSSYNSYNNFLRTHIYGHNLVTVKVDNRLIVPMAIDFYRCIHDVTSYIKAGYEKHVFPLVPVRNMPCWACTVKRTADPLIGFLLMGRMSSQESLRTAKTHSGEAYYGSGGCILDKDYTPLIVFAMEIGYSDGKVIMLSPVCIINPLVFQRDDLMSKYIVKKVIPLLSDYTTGNQRFKDSRIKVVISHEISKFIETPARPVGSIDKELWKCAEANVNEMLEV